MDPSRWTARLRGFGGRYATHFGLMWRAAPGWTAATAAVVVAGSGLGLLTMIATGNLVGAIPAAVGGGVDSAAADSMWRWFAMLTACLVFTQLVNAVSRVTISRLSAAHYAYVLDLVAEAGVSPYSIAGLDSGDIAGSLGQRITDTRDWLFRQGVENGWGIVQQRLSATGAFVIVLTWRWWAPFVVGAAFVLISLAASRWITHIFDQEAQTGVESRRADYLRGLLVGHASSKEVRLFALDGWLADRFQRAWTLAQQMMRYRSLGSLREVYGASVLMLLCLGGALAMLAHDAVTGAVTLGTAMVLVQALLGLEAFGMGGDPQTGLAKVTVVLRELGGLRATLDLPRLRPATVPGAPGVTPAQADRGSAAVDLDHVTFTYPTRERPTLCDLDLHIPAGQSVAVVGVNGAGKSTLIKLIAGLYPVDAGSVAVDGRDPGMSDAARRRVAVIFQDFVHYPFSLRDNVAMGALAQRSDDVVVTRALHDAGGDRLLTRLDAGLDTVLSAAYEGGTDLSGGQWQRVALARALAAVDAGAGVLVLDEPTAALDVRAEAALFERFLEVTRGITTILVSHRLSSVRHADRIVVLDGDTGRISEDGSHEQLMALGGAYAHMFTLQATRFARAGGADAAAPDTPAEAGRREGRTDARSPDSQPGESAPADPLDRPDELTDTVLDPGEAADRREGGVR